MTFDNASKKEYAIVAPGTYDTGDGYEECEAAFFYDNTDRNPVSYWGRSEKLTNLYCCVTFDKQGIKRQVERIRNDKFRVGHPTQLRHNLLTVDVDKIRIIEVVTVIEYKRFYSEVTDKILEGI